MNNNIFWILVYVILSQLIVNIIAIKILKRKSIEFIGPKINDEMPTLTLFDSNNIKCDLWDNALILFFNVNCTTCLDLINELKKIDLYNDIKLITYGTSEIIKEFKNKNENLENLYYISEKEMKSKLSIKIYPFVIYCENRRIISKNIASYTVISRLIELRGINNEQ